MWNDDLIFAPGGGLNGQGNPTFRMTAYLPYEAAHPYRMTEQWQALFDCFEPIIAARCDKVLMWDRPGAKARRGRKIQTGDWRPFDHLRSMHGDVSDGIFVGFSFLDRNDALEGNGRGPCSFRFFVGSAIRVEACIALEDFRAGRLDVPRMVRALQALPYVSFMAGYGLSLGSRFDAGDPVTTYAQLMSYARHYLAVDIARDENRAFFPGSPADFPRIGIAGINWITGIGEPFRSKFADSGCFSSPLPAEITVQEGRNGAVFQCGAAPVAGEEGTDDAELALLRALGSRLCRIYRPSEDDPRAPVFGGGARRQSLAWERRFYGVPA